MKKNYFSPVFSLARIQLDMNFCASTNVPNVDTNGLEGLNEDNEEGTWD